MDGFLEDSAAVLADLRSHGVAITSLSSREWEHPHPNAIDVLLRWLELPIDGRTKLQILLILGHRWAYPIAFPSVLHLLRRTDLKAPSAKGPTVADSLVSFVCSAPNKVLWPEFLSLARRSDLANVRGLVLHRAGRFKSHADEVMQLYSEYVGSDSPMIEMAISEGLRVLGDPRGVAILTRLNEVDPQVSRSKSRTLKRLMGGA